MLFEDVFLNPQQIKYLVNWLNLYNEEIHNKQLCGNCEMNNEGLVVNSVNGITMIATHRDYGAFNNDQLSKIKKFINDHRNVVGCQEVI